MEPNDALRAAIDRVYRVFGDLARPRRIDASPVVDEGVLASLITTPLRELADETIGIYAGAALNTAGTEEDYRYFLPRILEQAVRHPVWFGTEPFVIARKMDAAGWRFWPEQQKDAVEALFRAAWAEARGVCPDEEDAGFWLIGLTRLSSDPTASLSDWLDDRTPENMAQLASIVCALRTALFDPEDYWAEVDVRSRRALFDWFTSEPVETALIDAGGLVAESHRWLVDGAVDVIAGWRAEGFR